MLSRKLFIMLVITFALVLSNLLGTTPDLSYSNYSGSFTFEERNYQERNFAMCKAKFDSFKATSATDTILYRITPVSYWKFWNFSEYLSAEQFKLPYMSWDSISARRGKLENKSGYQDF